MTIYNSGVLEKNGLLKVYKNKEKMLVKAYWNGYHQIIRNTVFRFKSL